MLKFFKKTSKIQRIAIISAIMVMVGAIASVSYIATQAASDDTGMYYTTSDGHTVQLTRNVTLVETDYKIGLTKDFNSIVDESAQELSDIMKYWRKSEI